MDRSLGDFLMKFFRLSLLLPLFVLKSPIKSKSRKIFGLSLRNQAKKELFFLAAAKMTKELKMLV